MIHSETTVVVMVGAVESDQGPVAWVERARRAAARDLLRQLGEIPGIDRLILMTPVVGELAENSGSLSVEHVASEPGPIHMGQTLARLVTDRKLARLLYLGGASAPLMSAGELAGIVDRLNQAERLVISNNRYASDWAGVTPASALVDVAERLPRDNMLGWVLSTESGLPSESLPPSAASRLDIDTPGDLLVLKLHPDVQPALRALLQKLPLDSSRLELAIDILRTPASRVFVAGRIGPQVWADLNGATQCWFRVMAEERGMVSSGRQERGEVYSLLAAHIEQVGVTRFFGEMPAWADAAFIDTRVLLAHHSVWPSDEDRFASDLGLVAEISDPWLRAFTEAAVAAPIPVILGGHSLLVGDLLAICQILRSKAGDG